jgi:hypothetical protein
MDRIIQINPDKIKYIANDIFFDIDIKECNVIDGNWDVENLTSIEDFIIYRSLNDMFIAGKKWKETELYKFIKDQIDSNTFKYTWGCKNLRDLDNRGLYLINLYESIKEKGMVNHDLCIEKNLVSVAGHLNNDDIMIAIDRNGSPLFIQNGSHRLCIAKILGLKQIPVKIYLRHQEWINKKKIISDRCNLLWGGKSYHELPHPDLYEIEPIWPDTRYEIFKKNTNIGTGTLLDIGSLFGHIPYRAELDGYISTACEIDNNYLEVMKILRSGYDMKYNIIEKSFLDIEAKYDIIIAFNIFHHFLKNESLFVKLTNFLKKSEFKEMFLQVHKKGEKQMVGAYRDFSPEDFINYIKESTGKKFSIEIGEEMSRKIYKIY